jgi:hypothetical protein
MFGATTWQAYGTISRTWPVARDTRITNDSVFSRSVSSIALLEIKLFRVWNHDVAGMRCVTQDTTDRPVHESHE